MTRAKKAAAVESATGTAAAANPALVYTRIEWVKRPLLTERLIAYLVDNPSFRIKLFSDSAADAKKEGRAKKTGKEGKLQQYKTLAKAVFIDAHDKAVYDASEANEKKFAESVGQRLSRLRSDYKDYRKELGATGSSILAQTAVVQNRIDEIRAIWPWWDVLHGFWCELPNYAPCGVSASEPGTDHAAAAAKIFKSARTPNGLGQEEQDEMDDDPAADEDEDAPGGAAATAFEDSDDAASAPSSRMQSVSRGKSSSSAGEYDPADDDDDDDDDTSPAPPAPAPHAPLRAPAPKHNTSRSGSRSSTATSAPASRSSSSAPSGISRASSQQPAAKSAKAKLNPLEILRESRLADTERLAVKRRMEHDELMESANLKRRRMDLEHERATQDREHQAREARANREHQLELKRIELQILLAQRAPAPLPFPGQQLAPDAAHHVAQQHAPYAGLGGSLAGAGDDVFGEQGGAYEGLGGMDPGLGF